MAEYIEREALEVALNHRLNFLMAENGEYDHYTSGFDEAVTRVENFPAADATPVRHGYWRPILHVGGKTDYECSCCLGIIADVPDDDEHDLCAWCSMCGAKMDGGDTDAAD